MSVNEYLEAILGGENGTVAGCRIPPNLLKDWAMARDELKKQGKKGPFSTSELNEYLAKRKEEEKT